MYTLNIWYAYIFAMVPNVSYCEILQFSARRILHRISTLVHSLVCRAESTFRPNWRRIWWVVISQTDVLLLWTWPYTLTDKNDNDLDILKTQRRVLNEVSRSTLCKTWAPTIQTHRQEWTSRHVLFTGGNRDTFAKSIIKFLLAA